MSALPPKADIGAAVQNVRLVPIADIWLVEERGSGDLSHTRNHHRRQDDTNPAIHVHASIRLDLRLEQRS